MTEKEVSQASQANHESSDRSFEQKLLQREVLFATKLTLEELLPERHPETKGLLDNAPVNFQAWALGDSFLYVASFSKNNYLQQDQFYRLLKTAKPWGATRRLEQTVPGIVADWRIILSEVREKEPEAKRLYDYHTKYIPGFPEFEENHFGKFWDNISSLASSEDVFFRRQFWRFISKEELLARYGAKFYQENGLYPISVSYNYRKALAEFLNVRNIRIKFDPDMSVHDFADEAELVFSKIPDKRRSLLGKFYKELSADRGEVELALSAADCDWINEGRIMVDEDGKMQDRFVLSGRNEPFLYLADSIKSVGDGLIEVRKGQSYIRVGFEKVEDGYRVPIITEINIVSQIAPVVVWQKDKGGNGTFFCGKIPDSWIKAFPHLFSQMHDTLAGQLLVSAYSPQPRDKMPKDVDVTDENGKEKNQTMLEAQSVLLVPMYQELFLQESPLILGFEELVHKR